MAVYDNDKVAGRCRHNDQIEVTMVAGCWHGCNGQCHLMVLAMDDNKTSDNGYLMDVVMEYHKEVVWQWRQRLLSIAAAAAGD